VRPPTSFPLLCSDLFFFREAATKSVVRYAVRHYTPAAPSGSQLNLQGAEQGKQKPTLRLADTHCIACLAPSGYGVELAIKSTEYKVIDDKVPADEQSGEEKQTSPEQQEEEVEGFRFDVLKQRKPELASELDAFKEHLQLLSQQNEGLEQLRTWQLKGHFLCSLPPSARCFLPPVHSQPNILIRVYCRSRLPGFSACDIGSESTRPPA